VELPHVELLALAVSPEARGEFFGEMGSKLPGLPPERRSRSVSRYVPATKSASPRAMGPALLWSSYTNFS
jgi:hypothetical protein